MGDKKKESKWVCISKVGAVISTEAGGSIALKRGDLLEGEYYEQAAPLVQGLVRIEDFDEDFLAQLEKERRIRTGEAFPEDYARAKAGAPIQNDPRHGATAPYAPETLAQVVQEEAGLAQRGKK